LCSSAAAAATAVFRKCSASHTRDFVFVTLLGFLLLYYYFQLWVGVMITTQPFFIAGIDDAEEAKASAFGASGMFAFTFAASMLGIWYDSQNKADVMADGEGNNGSEGGYQLAQDNYPNYGGTGSS
jgi:hypothetical protein